MAAIYGELGRAQLENLGADPTPALKGRIIWNTVENRAKVDSSSVVRAFLLNDDKLVVGNNGTAANNVRLNRAGVGLLQVVLGNDVTAEGSLSTALASISVKQEGYVDAAKPAFGNGGRIIWVSDQSVCKLDTGAAWVTVLSSASPDGSTLEMSTNTLRIKDLGVTTAKINDGAVTQAKRVALGQQVSAVVPTGSFTTNSTTYVDATNLTVTITTTGRPVFIGLIADLTASVGSIEVYTTVASGATSADGRLAFLRAGSIIAEYDYLIQAAVVAGSQIDCRHPPPWFIDVVGAGTYTYKVQAKVLGANQNIAIQTLKLIAFEL